MRPYYAVHIPLVLKFQRPERSLLMHLKFLRVQCHHTRYHWVSVQEINGVAHPHSHGPITQLLLDGTAIDQHASSSACLGIPAFTLEARLNDLLLAWSKHKFILLQSQPTRATLLRAPGWQIPVAAITNRDHITKV